MQKHLRVNHSHCHFHCPHLIHHTSQCPAFTPLPTCLSSTPLNLNLSCMSLYKTRLSLHRSSPLSPNQSCLISSSSLKASSEISARPYTMSEHHEKSMTEKLQESAPNARQTVRFMTAATVGTILFILSGLTLTGTVLALIVATPLLVLFSPVLIPAGIALVLMIGGFVTSGGFGVAALSALTWVYNYVAGKHPVGADQLDRAKNTLAGKAEEYGQYVQHKAHEVTHTQGS